MHCTELRFDTRTLFVNAIFDGAWGQEVWRMACLYNVEEAPALSVLASVLAAQRIRLGVHFGQPALTTVKSAKRRKMKESLLELLLAFERAATDTSTRRAATKGFIYRWSVSWEMPGISGTTLRQYCLGRGAFQNPKTRRNARLLADVLQADFFFPFSFSRVFQKQ